MRSRWPKSWNAQLLRFLSSLWGSGPGIVCKHVSRKTQDSVRTAVSAEMKKVVDQIKRHLERNEVEAARSHFQSLKEPDQQQLLQAAAVVVFEVFLSDRRFLEEGRNWLARVRLESGQRDILEARFEARQGNLGHCRTLLLPHIKDRTAAALQNRYLYEYWYARCLFDCGRDEQALDYFMAVDRRFPGYGDTRQWIARIVESRAARGIPLKRAG